MNRWPRGLLLVAAAMTVGCPEPDPGTVSECPPPDRSVCPAADEGFVDPLLHVSMGNGSTFIEITDVVADGDRVFACTGVRGLVVWDASGDDLRLTTQEVAPPELIDSRFPRCQHVDLDRTTRRLVITNRGDEVQPVPWLAAFDVTDPDRPVLIDQWSDPEQSIEGAVIEGDRIIAAAHTSGVLELRLDGSQIVPVSAYADSVSDAWQVVLRGDTVIAAEGATGLRTYRLGPDGPQPLATVPIEGSSKDLIIQGDRAIVASSSALAIVDIADPAAPSLVSLTPVPGTALALAEVAPNTVVVAQWDELRGYDVSDPTAVVQVFSERLDAPAEFSRVLAVDADAGRGRVYAGEWHGIHALQHQPNGSAPELSATPQALQFGSLRPGEADDAVLVLRNDGDRAVTIHDIVSAADVSVDADCVKIDPGGAAAVEVKFEPTSVEELRTSVRVCSDDPDEPELDVSLSGNIAGVGIGDPVPEFRLQDTTGRTWSNADLQGRVAVLAYFATF